MKNRLALIPLLLISISGCSTHMTKVDYEGAGSTYHDNPSSINNVVVTDQRGTDSNWLGAIRGGYGNVLKTLKTEQSTDIVVDKMYTDALSKSGILSDSKDAPYELRVVITKYDCSYYFNREAHAHVDISLVDNRSSVSKFSKVYKSDETEGGVGAGIFGDVDTLRLLAEATMSKTIDKMLDDPEFIKALNSGVSVGVSDRLNQLESLYKDGHISEKEYKEKREEILTEL